MQLRTHEILLCIASCTHLAMLCDLQAMKPADDQGHENFDPNDEVLLRCFTIPALLDGLRSDHFDTGQGAKTDIILLWALGMHLEGEADKLSAEIFADLLAIYTTLSREHIAEWWRCISDTYRDENRTTLEKREHDLASVLDRWRNRRLAAGIA